MMKLKSIIGAKEVGKSSDMLRVNDKYSNNELAQIPWLNEQEVELAMAESVNAFNNYKKCSAAQRRIYLENILSLFQKKKKDFAKIICAEAGKPMSYAKAEVERCEMTIKLTIDESFKTSAKEVIVDYGVGESKLAFEHLFPVGVVVGITPFNFPLNLALHKIMPALLVGATILIKPSPYTPISLLKFNKLCLEAGLPSGVFQTLICQDDMSEKLVKDERIKLLTFTGSDKIGWKLKSLAGKKKVQLELGGNAACIISECVDSDELKNIAKQVAMGAYLYAGQICISTQRIFVHQSHLKKFNKYLLNEIKSLKTGDPKKESTIIGPMVDSKHLHRIKRQVDSAIKAGANLLCGGNILDEEKKLFQATLLTNVPSTEAVVKEEAFAPVAIVESFKDFDTAIKLVNDSKYGLQVGVFAKDINLIKKAFNEIEVGAVIANSIPGFRVDSMPYGGVKSSGLGREGIAYSVNEYTETRLLVF